MSNTALAERPLRQLKTARELLVNNHAMHQISLVCASHIDPRRMLRMANAAMLKNPLLEQTHPLNLLGAIMACSNIGLEPDTVLGHAFLIPRKNSRKGIVEVTFELGWKGMIDLARRSGCIASIHAETVYEGDEFSYEFGSNQHLKHIPSDIWTPSSVPTHAYCHARLADGGEAFVVMPIGKVNHIRDGSQAYQSALRFGNKNTPWITHFDAMARKTAVRRLFNELPISIEKVSDALRLDAGDVDFSAYALDPSSMSSVVEGNYEVTPDGEVVEEQKQPEAATQAAPSKPKAEKVEKKQPEPAKVVKKDKMDDDEDEKDWTSSLDPAKVAAYEAVTVRVANELRAAKSGGEVEAILEMFSGQIDVLREQAPALYADIETEADEARERVSK